MSSPTPIITPPPKRPKFNWSGWTRKLSTLVAAAATGLGTLATGVMGYYLTLSPEEKAAWPFWLPLALTMTPTVIAALGPVAVAFRQSFFESPDTDNDDA